MTTILDDVLLALEETAAENFHNDRCGMLLAAHNRLVRDSLPRGLDISRVMIDELTEVPPSVQVPTRKPWIYLKQDTEIDNREDPEE